MRKSTSLRYKPSARAPVATAGCCGSSPRICARPPKPSASARLACRLRHRNCSKWEYERREAHHARVRQGRKTGDIAPGEGKAVDVGARRIALFNVLGHPFTPEYPVA